MILYNITFAIEKNIEDEWRQWIKDQHIPRVMAYQLFSDYRFYKVLSTEPGDNPSYCLQYFVPAITDFQFYLEKYASEVMKHLDQYRGQYAAFQTILEEQ